jgi:hypothetical protein
MINEIYARCMRAIASAAREYYTLSMPDAWEAECWLREWYWWHARLRGI